MTWPVSGTQSDKQLGARTCRAEQGILARLVARRPSIGRRARFGREGVTLGLRSDHDQ
jgi:hypothetical protein